MTKQELKDLAQVIGSAIILTTVVWFWQNAKKETKSRADESMSKITQQNVSSVLKQDNYVRE